MKPQKTGMSLIGVAILLCSASYTMGGEGKGKKEFHARLDGAHETPAISTGATGTFRAELNKDGDELSYELEYADLEGGDTLFAHVHLGQKNVVGGVMFFLCGGGGKPACHNGHGTVTGTVNASNIIGPAGQGISAGEFDEAMQAMRDGLAYANVHTTTFTGGEIRGQVK